MSLIRCKKYITIQTSSLPLASLEENILEFLNHQTTFLDPETLSTNILRSQITYLTYQHTPYR